MLFRNRNKFSSRALIEIATASHFPLNVCAAEHFAINATRNRENNYKGYRYLKSKKFLPFFFFQKAKKTWGKTVFCRSHVSPTFIFFLVNKSNSQSHIHGQNLTVSPPRFLPSLIRDKKNNISSEGNSRYRGGPREKISLIYGRFVRGKRA